MVFFLHLSFHMGKLFTCCLPVPLFKALFILCHLILTTNPWRHGIVSTFQIRGARGPRSSSNFPLWPARPVPLAFWQQDQKEREEERRSGWTGRGLGDSAEECWKGWGHCSTSGRKQERRDRFRSSAVICVSPLDCWRNVGIELGLFWNLLCLRWQIVFLCLRHYPETGPHRWWLYNYQGCFEWPITMFQREFKIELGTRRL